MLTRSMTTAACLILLVSTGCRSHKGDDDSLTDTIDVEDVADVNDLIDVAEDSEPDDAQEDSDPDQLDVPADITEENTCIVPDVPVDTVETIEDVVEEDIEEDDLPMDPSVEDVSVEDVASEDVASEDIVVEDVAIEDVTSEDIVVEDVAEDEVVTPFTCGEVLTDPRDSGTYATVLIGTQCWMAENLDVGTFVPGTVNQADNAVIEKYCYTDTASNCDTYGALYQWDEMMDYGPSDAANPSTTRGICPAGWHVPSDEEFKVLEMSLGMTSPEADMVNAWRGAGVGTAICAGGSSGYEAVMSGRCAGGLFSLIDTYEYSYTSTEYGTNAWRRCFAASADNVGRWNTFPKTWALSVRCVLD